MTPLTEPEFPLARFASQLWDSGRVDVPDVTGTDGEALSRMELEEAEETLHHYERHYRDQLPGEPPEWNSPAAMWGLEMLYRACSFLLHREAEAETMQAVLSRPCPAKLSAAVCYSVDLSFRFLPDLQRLVFSVAQHDPLCNVLEKWGIDWPLSSVGIPFRKSNATGVDLAEETKVPSDTGLQPPGDLIESDEISRDLSGFWEHETLRRVYLDRILTTKDLSRLADPRVAEAIREALGNYFDLAPEIARELRGQTEMITPSPDFPGQEAEATTT